MNSLKKDILVFLLFRFFIGFYLANGTTVLFLQVLHFSFTRIFILTAVYMLMFILFEIPSGAVADLLGRKYCVAIGCASLAAGALATGSSNTFPQVFGSYFLWAFGFSMISGADEALLYDRLSDHGQYAKVIGRSHFFALAGTALAGIAGPYLYSLNFRYAYLFSAIPFGLALLAVLFFQEAFAKKEFSFKVHLTQIRTGTAIAFQNRYVLWAMIVASLVFGAAYTFSNFYQPYLRDVGFSLAAFSIILPAIFLTEAAGGAFSGKVYERLGEGKAFLFTLVPFGLLVGALGLWAFKSSLAILFAYTFVQGILRPLLSVYSNKHIESSHRATVISVQGMIGTVTAALMLFLFGVLTDRIGLLPVLVTLGGIVLAVGIVMLLARPKGSGE